MPWSNGSRGILPTRTHRDEFAGMSRSVLITGLVAAGLTAWAIYVFGPELVRYLKIRRM